MRPGVTAAAAGLYPPYATLEDRFLLVVLQLKLPCCRSLHVVGGLFEGAALVKQHVVMRSLKLPFTV